MKSASFPLADVDSQPTVFGVEFSDQGLDQIADAVTSELPPRNGGLQMVVTMNLDHVVTLRRNARFRAAYRDAAIVTADGFPVYLYARWRGAKVPSRVTGSDLFPVIMSRLVPGLHRPFLVASNEQTKTLLTARLEAMGFQPGQAEVVVPPFGFDKDPAMSEALLEKVEALGPTHIFMGVGAPKSEIWLHRHRERLGDAYAFAFGSGLDFFVGTVQRAPRAVREAGFEWLWRFASEPRRLFKRYFIDSWAFFAVVADDVRHKGQPFAR
jgi:N-acetylglucosaminyldiphosphoundecaprenol N-acetyl-beta-D-mannosaminyltransferase